MKILRFIVNLIGFDVAWGASVVGAGNGVWWAGLPVIALVAVVNLLMDSNKGATIRAVLAVAIIGAPVDTLLVLLGLMTFEPGFAPFLIWVFGLWVNFALTLGVSLRWLYGRWTLCVIMGAVGGPMTYWGGSMLGAIGLGDPSWLSLGALAVAWGALLPAVVLLDRRIRDAFSNDPTSEPSDGTVPDEAAGAESSAS